MEAKLLLARCASVYQTTTATSTHPNSQAIQISNHRTTGRTKRVNGEIFESAHMTRLTDNGPKKKKIQKLKHSTNTHPGKVFKYLIEKAATK